MARQRLRNLTELSEAGGGLGANDSSSNLTELATSAAGPSSAGAGV